MPEALLTSPTGVPAMDAATFQPFALDVLERAKRGGASVDELARVVLEARRLGYEQTEIAAAMYLERLQRGPYPVALRPLVARALVTPPPPLDDLVVTERALVRAGFPATAIVVQQIRRAVEAGRA